MAIVSGKHKGTITAEKKPLLWFSLLLAGIVSLPILSLLFYLFIPADDIREHLFETVLSEYLFNSITLSIGTAVGTFIIGTSTAWLCSIYHFSGRRFYEWALILPLAYPAYIMAYTYTGMLDYGGSVYTWLQNTAGVSIPINIRSLPGAIVIITLSLYPYVYLLARSAWLHKSNRLLEAGRILGASPWRNFRQIALPVSRPAIIAGIAIVVMETLADYGTVQYFGVNTFSVGILKTWFGLNSIESAAQLSIILLILTVSAMLIEKAARRQAKYNVTEHKTEPCYQLRGKWAVIANIICAVPVILGFIIPTVQLLVWTISHINTVAINDYLLLVTNTFMVAASGALIIVAIALILAYVKYLYPLKISRTLIQIASSGYAMPGIVIAVGVLTLAGFIQDLTNIFIGGSITMLLLAYSTRFLTLGTSTLDAAMEKISPNLNFAARTLNVSPGPALIKIYLPLVKTGILTALLLIFVDIIKELPATMVLRPFNFNTLAVRAYELASDERLADAALPALSIVAIGLLPITILTRITRNT